MSDDSLIGQTLIARYRVEKLLGRGAWKRTYEAYDVISGKKRALKTLELKHVEDWKAVELFGRQHDILNGLSHPGLPQVHAEFVDDAGEEPRSYVVEDLIEGVTLEEWAASGGRLNDESAREVLRELLEIVRYLHSQSPPVIHRDIKPSNIMRREDGSHVLIDFDTARGVSVDLASADGTMVGTAGFVPMEQLAGQVQPASDVYALGMTMVALLSGRDPSSLPVQRLRVRFEDYVNVSDELERLLGKMVEPAVEDRFTSAAEVMTALDEGMQRFDSPGRPRSPVKDPRAHSGGSGSGQGASAKGRSRSAVREDQVSPKKSASAFFREVVGERVEVRGESGFSALVAQEAEILRNQDDVELVIDVAEESEPSDRELVMSSAEHVASADWDEDDIADTRVVWATSGRASSTYGVGWTADRACGPPDVFPRHGDHVGAWAPDAPSDGAEWLELTFPPNSPRATEIRVFETLEPGAIVRVEERSDGRRVLWQGPPSFVADGSAKVFRIRFKNPQKLRKVRLVFDTSVSPSWNEVDAVAIVGTKPFLDNLPTQPDRSRSRSQSLFGRKQATTRGGHAKSASGNQHPRPAPRSNSKRTARTNLVFASAGLTVMIGAIVAGILVRTAEPEAMQPSGMISEVSAFFPDYGFIAAGDKVEWATQVIDYSSQYDAPDWGASQVLFMPDIYPANGDISRAWAPEAQNGGSEYVSVAVGDLNRSVGRILVVETYNPGAIAGISIMDASGAWIDAWEGSTNDGESRSRFLAFDLQDPVALQAVRVEMRTGRVSGWNEIDAIGVVYVD